MQPRSSPESKRRAVRLTWPIVVVALGALFGIAAMMKILYPGPVDARLTVVLCALWQARGASIAAAIILLGTAGQQLAHRPLSSFDGRAARAVALGVGLGLFVSAAILTTIVVDTSIVVLGLIGAAYAIIGGRRHGSGRWAVGVLVAGVLLFEVPRELGMFNVTWDETSSTTDSHRQATTSPCVKGAIRRGTLQPIGSLDGNVGAMVFPDDLRAGSTEVVRFAGSASVSWFRCMLPLVKPVSIDTTFDFDYHSGACSGGGTLALALHSTTTGIQSCHGLRVALARKINDELTKLAASIGD